MFGTPGWACDFWDNPGRFEKYDMYDPAIIAKILFNMLYVYHY